MRLLTPNSPGWRAELVEEMLAVGEEMPRSESDPLVRDYYHFRRRWTDKAITHDSHHRLRRDHRAIYDACALFENFDSERWILEAMVMSDKPVTDIAGYIGHSAEVISTFERLFWDIRPRLKFKGFILNRIFLPAVRRGLVERDYDMMYKAMAYYAGWELTEEVMGFGQLSDKARNWLQTATIDNTWRRGFAASQRLEINNYNAVEVLNTCLKLKEIEAQRGGVAAQEEAMRTLGSLLETCATTVLPGGGLPDNSELRATELLGGPLGEMYKKVEGTAT